VQIREKRLTARLLFELATAAASITQGSATKLVINDRADIAIAAGANGVHLTSHSLPTDVVRKMVPEHFIVGRSAHSVDEVLSARKAGADYVLFGPVFETPGKDGTQGLDRLREACVATRTFPVIAIGGIDDTNVRIALDAGAAGVAAIRALGNRESMEKLTALVNAI
jgi:thiamine-phosphate pyrophosphorylase